MRMRLLLSPWAIAGVMLCSYDAGEAATRARALADTVINDAPVRLAAGEQHTCQIKEDGTVRCWGYNFSGQLGDGTTDTPLTPVAVSGVTGAVALAAGSFFTCALPGPCTRARWWPAASRAAGAPTARASSATAPPRDG